MQHEFGRIVAISAESILQSKIQKNGIISGHQSCGPSVAGRLQHPDIVMADDTHQRLRTGHGTRLLPIAAQHQRSVLFFALAGATGMC